MSLINGDSLLIEEVLKIVVIGEPNTGKVSKKKKINSHGV